MLIDCHAHHITAGMIGCNDFWGPHFDAEGLKVGHWRLRIKKKFEGTPDEVIERIVTAYQPENRAKVMDKAGVDKLIVSVPAHVFMYWAGDFGDEYATICNNEIAAVCKKMPDRFDFFAHANLANPEGAARELERAITQLGAKGLSAGGANFGGIEAHDERLYPVWEVLQRHDLPIMIHGYNQSIWWGEKWEDDPFDTTSVVGDCADETLFFWYLINGGALDVFPNLKIYINHAGGFVPYQLGRFNMLNKSVCVDSRNKRDVMDYMGNFYFDLDLHHPSLRKAVVDIVGVDRLLYGTNFGGEYDFGDLTEGVGLSDSDREKIRSGNAIDLLRLKV